MAQQGDLKPAEAQEAGHCYRCGAVLTEDSRNCPQCGRRQARLCYCGQEIPVTSPSCPFCGADWSTAFRVRRKTRNREFSWKLTAAYAAAGALAAIILAAFANSFVGALAIRSLPPGTTGLPASFLDRLGLAVTTVGRALGGLAYHVSHLGGGPTAALILVMAGAVVGAVVYLYRAGALRLRWPLGFGSFRKRRRRAGEP